MSRSRELPVPHGAAYEMHAYHYCGPATLKAFLACYGLRFTQRQLAHKTGTTKANGTSANGMKRAIGHLGIRYRTKVDARFADIEHALTARKPTIVCYVEPFDEEPHYAIPVWMTKRFIWLRDSWNSQRRRDKKSFRLTREDFYRRWTNQHRWILIPKYAPKW